MRRNCISTTRLAEICGVSQGTVDRALNNRPGISPKTKERVLAAAKEYGYRPNIHARSMAGGRSMLIGVVVFDLYDQYFSDILIAIEEAAAAAGYSTIVMFTDKDEKKEIDCIHHLYHMAVDGIVLCPVNSGTEYTNFLLSLDIPIVTIGNRLENIPYAGIDNAAAMQEVVQYVLKAGYERLVYVLPHLVGNNTFAQTERLSAFRDTCRSADVETVFVNPSDAATQLVGPKKTAVICPCDTHAIPLLDIARQHHAGVIGFNNVRLLDQLELRLDSIAYDIPATAAAVVNYVIHRTPVTAAIPHQLIIRGSV